MKLMSFSYRSTSQKRKTLKYGGYTVITALIVLLGLVLVNVLFNLLGWRVDLSRDKLYTPGDRTLSILGELQDDITIYGLYNTGTETTDVNRRVIKLVEEYASLSDKITFEKVDPLDNPAFANQFLADDSDSLENGSLVVQNERTGKFNRIPLSNMYVVTTDYSSLARNVTGFSAEEALTAAIRYVSMEESVRLIQLQGHSEASLNKELINYLSYSNIEVSSMNLIQENITELEANAYTIVVINNPRADIGDAEYNTLLKYMEEGGHILFMAENDTPELPNFGRLLGRYGMSLQTGIMCETSSNYYYMHPQLLYPILAEGNEITKYFTGDTNNTVLMYSPAAVIMNEEKNFATKVSAFVTTSENALIKGEGNNGVVFEEGDTQGPFNLAVMASESTVHADGTPGTSKMVVLGSSTFVDESQTTLLTYNHTGNYKLFAIICDYLQDGDATSYISAKNLEEGRINTVQSDVYTSALVFVVLIPGLVILAGVIIFLRRKHL